MTLPARKPNANSAKGPWRFPSQSWELNWSMRRPQNLNVQSLNVQRPHCRRKSHPLPSCINLHHHSLHQYNLCMPSLFLPSLLLPGLWKTILSLLKLSKLKCLNFPNLSHREPPINRKLAMKYCAGLRLTSLTRSANDLIFR